MKMIFGGVYVRKGHDTHNDQHYYIYIPVIYQDTDGVTHYRMVDTYVISNPCWGKVDMEKRLWYLEQANRGETSYKIFHDVSGYFYKNIYSLPNDELDENEWELLADLHDYRPVDDYEVYDYLKEDKIMYIPLWQEDCYRWGSGRVGHHYVKKVAKKDGYLVYCNALNNYSFGFDEWKAKNLKETCKDVLQNMTLRYGKKKEIKNMLKKIKKYIELSKEYDKFCKTIK